MNRIVDTFKKPFTEESIGAGVVVVGVLLDHFTEISSIVPATIIGSIAVAHGLSREQIRR